VRQQQNRAVLSAILPAGIFHKLGDSDLMTAPGTSPAPSQSKQR
jgi:hypothetical protein